MTVGSYNPLFLPPLSAPPSYFSPNIITTYIFPLPLRNMSLAFLSLWVISVFNPRVRNTP